MEELGSGLFVLVGIVEVLVIGAMAFLLIRSKTFQRNHEEAVELADIRGKRNTDLEHHVARLEERVGALETEVKILQSLKAHEIAVEVSKLLKGADSPDVPPFA
jgi:predicted Ser/Thr protein kinase